ncbi:MAG: hypothetical protein J6A52_02165 [Bacilli bacterium]|nr:hypothetical protein [Bacilli bacterium]
MKIEMKELLEKYEKAIEIGVVNKSDLISCSEEEMSIYKNIDIDTLLYLISCSQSLEDVLRKHLSLDNIREIVSFGGKDKYLKDINIITELSVLDVCAEYPLIIADLFAVASESQSLMSPFHDVHMQSLATNVLSSDDGSMKEAKSYALKEAILKGKVDTIDGDNTKKIYPSTHLKDLFTILNADCEEACFALGRVVAEETLDKWDIRNKYMEEISQSIDSDRIDVLADVAVNRNSIESDYYGLNIEMLGSMGEVGTLEKLVATNPASLDSAYHSYNMGALPRLAGSDIRSAIEVLTSLDSLESGSHMSNVEEYIERLGITKAKKLEKALN